MTSPHDRSAPPSLLEPPIDRLPGVVPDDDDVLEDFAASARPWSHLPVPLSAPVTFALWMVVIASGGFSGWLVAVLSGAAPCEGFPCAVATLGGHPGLLLALAGSGAVLLMGVATVTRGLTRAGAPQLAVIVVATVAGIASLLGVAALLLVVALGMGLVGALFVFLVDRTS
ncbi:hypothetical protein [Pseudonocardia acaciae]|uniref:hypothetical protein n=1 Tax=Pseudonocardia acaciae TaxID=551276 RepID=UPI00048AB35B|nr:hypothetical protein [Pseudonocardia acaciae]